MRIAVVNWTSRMAGGAENYLRQILPALHQRGHQIAFVHETAEPAGRESVALISPELVWCIGESGVAEVLDKVAAWRPDVLFVHGLREQDWIAETVQAVPSVFFCHDYAGICISGTKTFRTVGQACHRAFGWPCLAHFYPCRCGGLNPLTMLRDYGRQSQRLAFLRKGKALVTSSEAMRRQYLNNGFNPERVYLAPYPVAAPSFKDTAPPGPPWKILFAGRMEWMKGGDVLLDALPATAQALGQPLHVIFSGDGRARADWERRAEAIAQRVGAERLRIEFIGWQPAEAVEALLAQVHLLAFPSVWPEPFGLIGVEAGHHGVPAAAFRTGGIPDWLSDGVNGFMSPANPPSARGLAEAMVRCLGNADIYRGLRAGAVQMAQRFSMTRHMECLERILMRC